MENNNLYQEYQEQLSRLNKEINKIMYLKENWEDKELMNRVIEMEAKKRETEYTIYRLELEPEKPKTIESTHPHKKTHHEAKGYVKQLDSDNWIQHNSIQTIHGNLNYTF